MKIVNFIICDDIRNEIRNKHSLIGVYNDSIEFSVHPEKINQWPKFLKLGIYIRFKFEEDDLKKNINKFNLLIKYNNETIEIGNGFLPKKLLEKSNVISLAFVNNNFLFKEEGKINFFIDFFNKNNEKIETLSPDITLQVSEKVLE